MSPPTFAVVDPELQDATSGKSLGQSAAILNVILKSFTVVNASTALETFLYGVHCILFAICCFVLAKKQHPASMIFLAAAIIMFGLSTGDITLTLRMQLADTPKLLQGEMSLDELIRRGIPKGQLFVANNLIADLLLLYRCFLAWGFRRSVLAVSVLLLLADTVWGWVGAGIYKAYILTSWEKFTTAYSWSIFGVNIVMTMLIVGRLWWMTRRARHRLGSQDLRVYHTVIVVFAETALIYSTCVLITIVLPKSNSYIPLAVVASIRLVSIMPTLLIVQIAAGRPYDDRFNNSTVESTEHPNTTVGTSAILDTMITTQASARNGEAQEVPLEEEKPNSAGASV